MRPVNADCCKLNVSILSYPGCSLTLVENDQFVVSSLYLIPHPITSCIRNLLQSRTVEAFTYNSFTVVHKAIAQFDLIVNWSLELLSLIYFLRILFCR